MSYPASKPVELTSRWQTMFGGAVRFIGILVVIATTVACSGSESTAGPTASVAVSGTATVVVDGQALGTVELPVSCNAVAAARMAHGLALLHHMMYTQADGVFQSATEADSSCAMAYWGRAMTLIHPMWPDVPTLAELERGAELVTEALITGVATDREGGYVDAVGGYFQDAERRPETERLSSFKTGWQRVHERFPEDREATAFHALSSMALGEVGVANATESAMSIIPEMKGLLEQIPDHPGAHHYAIHAYDYVRPDTWALEVARSYGKLAPEVPHTLHMPTHIFSSQGLWSESIEQNERSAAAAREQGLRGAGLDNHYPHALGYLVYAHLQSGQDGRASQIVDQLRAVEGPFSQLNRMVVAAHLTGIRVRYVLERHAWHEAAQLEVRATKAFPWNEYPQFDALTEYGRAVGLARLGDAEAATAALAGLHTALDRAGPQGTSSWLIWDDEVLEMTAAAWVDFVNKDIEGAVPKMEAAAKRSVTANTLGPGELLPAAEQLADMYFELGRYREALTTYEAVLARLPNRLNSICGVARAADLLGDPDLVEPHRESLEAVMRSEAAGRCLTNG